MDKSLQYYFGIDFGTTNSATVGYAVFKNNKKILRYGDDELRPIPSVVAIDRQNGTVYTGREAWERRQELSQTCEFIPSVKTLLDQEWSKVIAGKKWTPDLVAAEVFKCLQKNVFDQTGVTMENTIVAIPVGFSAKKRNILRKAALKAGITIKSFVTEPTAAFFANYDEVKNDNTVAVFDWGGGTLDVSVIRHYDGKIYELATGGMSEAGDAIDLILANKLHSRIERKKKLGLSYDDMSAENRDMMLVRAERAKRALSEDDTAIISINHYGEYGAIHETLDYDWFAEIIGDIVDRAINCIIKVVKESGVKKSDIDRVIMEGGSSNIGPLISKMEGIFGDKLYFPDETMWNVGIGAAMLAATPGTYYSNQKIGLRLSDGHVFPLLKEGEALNGWKQRHHFGIIDSDKEARFVFTGSQDIDEDDNRYSTMPVPAYRFLQEHIILDVSVDENLVFNARATSTMRPSDIYSVWKYERLKCFYKLPKEGGIRG
jgi:molecular chaperone DnaK